MLWQWSPASAAGENRRQILPPDCPPTSFNCTCGEGGRASPSKVWWVMPRAAKRYEPCALPGTVQSRIIESCFIFLVWMLFSIPLLRRQHPRSNWRAWTGGSCWYLRATQANTFPNGSHAAVETNFSKWMRKETDPETAPTPQCDQGLYSPQSNWKFLHQIKIK